MALSRALISLLLLITGCSMGNPAFDLAEGSESESKAEVGVDVGTEVGTEADTTSSSGSDSSSTGPADTTTTDTTTTSESTTDTNETTTDTSETGMNACPVLGNSACEQCVGDMCCVPGIEDCFDPMSPCGCMLKCKTEAPQLDAMQCAEMCTIIDPQIIQLAGLFWECINSLALCGEFC